MTPRGTSDSARLAAIREAHRAIAPGRWARAADGDGEFLEAAGEMGELVPVARFHPGATEAEKDFCAAAPGHVGFLLGLVDRAIVAARAARGGGPGREGAASPPPPVASRHPPLKGEGNKAAPDFAAEASMQCGKPAFKKFLMERHGLESPASDERTLQKLRSVLGIGSRRELNADEAAAARWKKLRAEFKAWRARG